MKYALAVAVLICVAVTGAWAQGGVPTARALGMGTAVIGIADDGAAWSQNPAGLGALNVPVQAGKMWGIDAIGSYGQADDDEGDFDAWSINVSGWLPEKGYGLGVGYADLEDSSSAIGAGFGMKLRNMPLSVGINVMDVDADDDDYYPDLNPVQVMPGMGDYTPVSLGFLYEFEQPQSSPIRLGVTVEDLFDDSDMGPMLNAGIAWPATQGLLLAADVRDITDETDDGPLFSAGLEYRPAKLAEWAFRAGVMDDGDGHDLTLGAGYAWDNVRVDAAWADTYDGTWEVSVGLNF